MLERESLIVFGVFRILLSKWKAKHYKFIDFLQEIIKEKKINLYLCMY